MTVDLSTTWLGLELPHPVMPGASPLVDDLDTVKRLEDAGAACIVMHSLFEEQLQAEQMAAYKLLDGPGESYAEATSYFPTTSDFNLGPDAYLEQIRKIREAVELPVIGSLNGSTPGGWLEYAKLIEDAGASALELNMYRLPSDPAVGAWGVEEHQLEMVRAVKRGVTIPVAVKLSPFYTSLPHFVSRLQEAGVAGVVVFNRFYQADIDPDSLSLNRTLQLSDRTELLLRLRWLAILSARTPIPLGCSGGVFKPIDVVKALMAGASAVQTVSALLEIGPKHLTFLREGLSRWLEEHEYESVTQLIGSMNLARCPDPSEYERSNYIKLLQSYHGAAD